MHLNNKAFEDAIEAWIEADVSTRIFTNNDDECLRAAITASGDTTDAE